MDKLKTYYTKEELLYWLNKLDNYVRDYADKIDTINFNDKNNNSIYIVEIALNLKQACDDLKYIDAIRGVINKWICVKEKKK